MTNVEGQQILHRLREGVTICLCTPPLRASIMRFLGFVVILIFSIQTIAGLELETSNSTESRSERFFSLFSVVRFSNSFCYGSNGYNGTCLTTAECSNAGGTSAGSCASGFGVCCTIFVSTCGKTITRNNTYWVQPGFNSSYATAGQCSVYVKKCAANICQLRLDFIDFGIAFPDQTAGTATQCLTDIFTVSGQSNNVPGICGWNPGQHLYLDMTPGTSQFTLNFLLTGTSTSRYWNIRIAQIPCGTSYTAPDNCLQWFTSSVGTFSSFDYTFASAPTVQHLANQDYTICIRMNQGFCGICYQVCTSGLAAGVSFNLDATAAPAIDKACSTDFIQIPCAVDYQSTGVTLSTPTTPPQDGCTSKICGNGFNAAGTAATNSPVYSYRKPFEVRFYTDSSDTATANGIGFCLQYQQLACNSG